MARVIIKNNSTEPLGGPNLGLGTDQGDSLNTTVANLNNMFAEQYNGIRINLWVCSAKISGKVVK
jgi:hypothetical protein